MANTNPLVLDYVCASPLELPLKHSEKPDIMKIEKLHVNCKLCKKETESLRGSSTEHSSCIDIKVAGLCSSCKCITWARFRVYPDHLLSWHDDGLKQHDLNVPFWKKALIWLFF
jgi:hypothetical protein